MQLNTNLSQKQELKLIIAPRMIQSMEILQLPVMALQERIEHELQENPVLELKEAGSEQEQEGETAAADGEAETAEATTTEEEYDPANDPQQELVIDEKGDNEEDFDRLAALSEDWADHFNEET